MTFSCFKIMLKTLLYGEMQLSAENVTRYEELLIMFLEHFEDRDFLLDYLLSLCNRKLFRYLQLRPLLDLIFKIIKTSKSRCTYMQMHFFGSRWLPSMPSTRSLNA